MGTRVSAFDRLLPSYSVVARKAPVWFATRLLGVHPWSNQVAILTALRDHEFVAVRSGNESGKMFTAMLTAPSVTIIEFPSHSPIVVPPLFGFLV